MANAKVSSEEAYAELRQLWTSHSDDLMGRAVDLGASPAGAMQVTEDAYVELFSTWREKGGSFAALETYIEANAANFADHEGIPSGWKSVSERTRSMVWFERPKWVNVVIVAGALLLVGALVLTLRGGSDDDIPEDLFVQASTTLPAPTTTTTVALPDDMHPDTVDLRGEDTIEIAVSDNAFGPRDIIVSPGAEIIFTNNGQNLHNVRPAKEDLFVEIPTELLNPDMSASLSFDAAGDYGYFCSIHGTATRGQRGRIIVA